MPETANLALMRAALAPEGVLRAAINLGNAVLARRGDDEAPSGVTVDLSHDIARRLEVSVSLPCFDTAAKVVEALGSGDFASPADPQSPTGRRVQT